jgi:hypothetical protein
MTRRRAFTLAVVVLTLAAASFLIPGSPLYLPGWFFSGGVYEGRSGRAWVNLLNDPDADIRRQAIFALGTMGNDSAASVPALARILVEDKEARTRVAAALALTKMAPASKAAVPELTRALEDRDGFVRMNAAYALMRLRGDARPAVPTLIKALASEDNKTNLGSFTATVREVMAVALGHASAGTAEAVPALTEALETAKTDKMKRAAARALGEVGPEAKPAAAALRKLLNDPSPDVTEAVREALEKIGAEAEEPQEKDKRSAVPPADHGEKDPVLAQNLELPEEDRKYLWEIEHHGNVLVKHGFGPLAEALKRADAADLGRLLADDFAGGDLGQPRAVRAANAFAEVERLQDAGHPPAPLRRAAFVARLLEFRKVFPGEPPQVKLSLMQLAPRERGRLGGEWEGTAQLRLHGEHGPGAPAEVVVLLRYRTAPPTKEALARPGWVRAAFVQQVLTARAPRYLFAEVGRKRGLDPSLLTDNWKCDGLRPTTGGVYVCDFDRDGFLDMLVTDAGCHLYKGGADGFEDMTARSGLRATRFSAHAVAWADLDGDGWDDLILGERVYRNERGVGFSDYTDRCSLRLPSGGGNLAVADYDRDGRLDLYAAYPGQPGARSWLDGKSSTEGNRLYRNRGGWQFEDVTRSSGTSGGQRSTFAAAWLDADNDGWPDLHVPNEFGDGVLLVNNRDGSFTGRPLADRPADFGTMGLAAGDVDNDGNIDLYCADMYSKAGTRVIGNLPPLAYQPRVMEKMRRFVAGSQLHLNRGGLKFEQAGPQLQLASVGWAYGPCLADLDNDGWLDVYATAGYVSRDRNEPDG